MKKVISFLLLMFFLLSGTALAVTLYEDDFEDGTLNYWPRTGPDVAIATDQANSGTYSAKFTMKTSSSNTDFNTQLGKNVTLPKNFFIRWYQRWQDGYSIPGGHQQKIIKVRSLKTQNDYYGITWYFIAGTYRWRFTSGYENYDFYRDAQFAVYWDEKSPGSYAYGGVSNAYTIVNSDGYTFGPDEWVAIEIEINTNDLGANNFDATSNNGYFKCWINGTLTFHMTDLNIRDYRQNHLWNELFFNSTRQPEALTEQYSWIDDVVVADSYIGLIGAGDVAAPYISSLSPDASEVGVLTTADVVAIINDDGDGVVEASVELSINGVDVSGQLAFGGTAAVKTLTLSNYLTLNSYNQVITRGINANDGTNTLKYFDTFKIRSDPNPGNVFGTGDENDFSNWTPLNASRWAVVDNAGDDVLELITTDYSNNGQAPGEYSVYDLATYSEFEISYEFTSTENQATNAFVDTVTLFFYQDANNYSYVLWNKDTAPSFEVFSFLNGERTQRGFSLTSVVDDNSAHTLLVRYEDNVLTVKYDGTTMITVNNYDFAQYGAGKLGIGGYNDAGKWDDITITDLASTPTPPPEPPPPPSSTGTVRVIVQTGGTSQSRIQGGGQRVSVK